MRISPSANGAYRMSHNEPPAHVPLGESRPDNFLDSWKEIAAYLEREVRTVQRWEKKEGPPYTDKSTKNWGRCMPKSEIDAWWRERSAKLASKPENREIAGGRALSNGLQGRRKHQMRNARWRLDRVGRGARLQS